MISGDFKIRVHLRPENLGVLCIKISVGSELPGCAESRLDFRVAHVCNPQKPPGCDAVKHDAERENTADSRILPLSFVGRRCFTI